MPSDYALPSSRPRPFATVPYVAGGAATLEPAVMPPSCAHALPGDPACVLVVHHTRERKAGPQIFEIGRGNLRATVAFKSLDYAAAAGHAAVAVQHVIAARKDLWP